MSESHYINQKLKHLYLSPLSACNLNCKMCYTSKNKQSLDQAQILEFVERYQHEQQLETITLCGGELFLMKNLPLVVNELIQKKVFVQLITNGTINRLKEFEIPNKINMIVSLDGLPEYHELNRGQGSWHKSIYFMQQADQLGFHLSVFSVVTQQNFKNIAQFEHFLKSELGFLPDLTYHPRKPKTYLEQHSKDNRIGQVRDFEFITVKQQRKLWASKQTFPPNELGCYQISVFADGLVYGCCEGDQPLGSIKDPVSNLIDKFKARVKFLGRNDEFGCQGCTEPGFVCGLKRFEHQE